MSISFKNYNHWQVQQDAENLVWILCDRQSETVNSLSRAVIEELGSILGELEKAPPVGVIVGSAKSASFIVGADIREFDQFSEAAEVSELIAQGHEVYSRLENLPCPTVAAVHGYCLGGGLELALCCDYIVALNVPETRIGLPEVKLGIFPALGGATRLTERMNPVSALQLMLTGRLLRAPDARRQGVIDELADEFSSLHWVARRAVLQKRRRQGPGLLASVSNLMPARALLSRLLASKTAAKVRREHYPAPFELIDLWREHRDNRKRMFQGEAQRVGELMVGETARNLRRIYFLTERMKAQGKDADFSVRRVHVVGAGVMGGDIAAWCVLQGLEVTLQDRGMEYIEPALDRARKLFRKRLKKKPAIVAAQSRLIADVQGDGIARADVIIEAIYENEQAKRDLYATIEPRMADHAILATNTSALPLEALARDLQAPERLIGLHFFNPVAKMPLVEVVHGAASAPEWVARGCAFCTAINRFALPTRSSPGFLVNRVLAPYLMEAFTVLMEGRDKDIIDAAAVRFGMPMGPIELADVVGLDVCMNVAQTLAKGEVDAHRALLQEKLDAGELGKKSGQGFYTWKKGKPVRGKVSLSDPEADRLAQRLMKPFLDEARQASEEGIVEDDDLLDAGIIFGTGFAPFRGGPMHYLKQQQEQGQ